MRRKPTDQERYTFNRVLGGASQIFDIAPDVIVGRSRLKRHTQPRAFVCYACSHMGLSTTVLGGLLERDHTTVIKSIDRFRKAMVAGSEWASRAMGLWLDGSLRDERDGLREGADDVAKNISNAEELRFLRLRVSELENAITQAASAIR